MGIDAPEVGHPRKRGGSTPGQPWGDEARRVLADRVLKQFVTLEVYAHDRHRRILGVIYQGHTKINVWLVQSGLAEYYRGGRNDAPADLRRQLEEAEQDGRRGVRRLWVDTNSEPPWTFRRRGRVGR